MSGLLRNFFTLLFATFGYGKSGVQSRLASRFVITPFDAGVAVLKSDKYFQLAEAAQLDFVVRTGLIGPLPAEVQRVTVFSAGIATGARQPDAARALIRYLNSAAAAPTIAKTGLEPITAR